jgi:N-methylhydantoinase A
VSLHVALDIGGTFTDLVAIDDDSGELRHAKSSTTPDDLTVGIARCLEKSGVALERCETFVHGATVAINTLVEHTGARTVLLTTQGARDVYLIGRGNRPEAYNVFFQRPTPLVRRGMILEVAERMAAGGTPILALTDEAITDACERVARMEPESVAVCLLHAYTNPVHEQRLGAALRAALPGVYVSLSHEILRQYREYERTSTTVVNSYVGPKVERYLHRLESELAAKRFTGSLLIMQSNGGVTSLAGAARAPVALMESGPVGGINAAAQIGARLGFPQVISFDMGGTTAKASLIRDGEPSIAEGYYVGGYASGHPVMLPVVDIIEVGAGGGSIAWIDEVGALKVGPRSAGASPGPACYGTGGEDPTVTDANVLLGRINPAAFLDGEMQLDVAASRAAIERRLCGALGRDVIEVALGIIRIAVAHMTLAVRGISIERGFDPRDFVMLVSGGNGGLHGPLIARELGIPKVIVPVLPAHGSALGMLMTDIRHDYVSTQTFPLRTLDFTAIRSVCDEFRRAGLRALEEEGVAPAQQEVRLSFDLRYLGQEYSLNVPVPEADLDAGDRDAIRARYNALHQRTYGQSSPSEEAEVVNVRVSVHGWRKKFGVKNDSAPAATSMTTRAVYLDDPHAPVNVPIHRRAALPPGSVIDGPAILEDSASTVLLLARDRAVILETGEIVIDIGV